MPMRILSPPRFPSVRTKMQVSSISAVQSWQSNSMSHGYMQISRKSPKHMEGIVEQMRNTKDVELAVFLYENEDHTFKVSFRVNGAFDAASLAMHFGGGGHVKAAGCTVEGPAEEAIEHILAEVEKRL